jgi:hypothetical protein
LPSARLPESEMHLEVVGDTLLERVALRLNLVPLPIAHTHMVLILARAIVEGARAGVFEALDRAPLTAGEVASQCALDAAAAGKMLGALASSGYLVADGSGPATRFALTRMARKWMLPQSPASLHDQILFTVYEDEWIGRMGEFLRTGREVSDGGHDGTARDAEFWRVYQRAMRAIAGCAADEVGRRTYVPRGARRMLDIGGSHGLYSVAICRRHPALASTILDLPEAIEHAAPLLAQEGLGDRVTHRAGNVLESDLGIDQFDVVYMSNLVHHFDAATNQALFVRIARALRPGGVVIVQELIRRETYDQGNQLGALLDLFFALTSEAGTWSVADIASWGRAAGLAPRKPLYLRTMPGSAQQGAVKPR